MSGVTWREERGPGGGVVAVAELDGGRAGPTWLLTAGVHGDEYEGPEAIRRALRALAGTPFDGRVIALPVVNPMAYAAGVRSTPADQGNLNRLFPGDAEGTITRRWAEWIWRTFVMRADRLVDLHAGGAFFEFDPVAGFYADEDAPLAAVFDFTMWRAPSTPGVFSCEFRKHRGPALGVELGFGATRSEPLTQAGERALVKLVRGETGQVDGPVFRNHDVLATHSGEWTPRCICGQMVMEGDVLGVMHGLNGALIGEVICPVDGRVLAFRRVVSAAAGDLLVGVGVEE